MHLQLFKWVGGGLTGCGVYLEDLVGLSDGWEEHLQRLVECLADVK